jgi:hypothetical protein
MILIRRLLHTVSRAATISIFADEPRPSDEMTVAISGGIMRSLFAFAGPLHTCSTPAGP